MTEHDVTPATDQRGPLDGIRVLDLTSVVMGPLATQQLGDLGAEVIVIEDAVGDTNRGMGAAPAPGLSGVALNLMRNKRSVSLNLKSPEGREACLEIAATCDVVATNLRPGPLGRLGLAYDDVRQVRPDVVFCQAHGFPSDTEMANAPAYDDIIQSASGVGDLFLRMGVEPTLLPTLVADKVSGLTIANAITAALFHRERTGEGQFIEVPMIDVMQAFVLAEHGAGAIPEPALAPPGYPRILTPQRKPQPTSDGWINVLPYHGHHFATIFEAGGRDDLLDDPRFATRESRFMNSDSLYRDIASILATESTQHWIDFCAEHDIPATRAASLDDVMESLPLADHPHVGAYRHIPHPVRYSETPAALRRPAPALGEHYREVLAEVGYSDDVIDAMVAGGVVHHA